MQFIAKPCQGTLDFTKPCDNMGIPCGTFYYCIIHHPHRMCKYSNCTKFGKICQPIHMFDNWYIHKGFDCGQHRCSNKVNSYTVACEPMIIEDLKNKDKVITDKPLKKIRPNIRN